MPNWFEEPEDKMSHKGVSSNANDKQHAHSSYFFRANRLLTEFNLYRKPYEIERIEGTTYSTNVAQKAITYLFVTVPDLNIGNINARKDSKNEDSIADNRRVLELDNNLLRPKWLSEYLTTARGPWLPLLTNTAMSFPTLDPSIDTFDMYENWDRNKMTLPKDDFSSKQTSNFQIEFLEFSGQLVATLIEMWIDYIVKVTKGIVYASESNIKGNILDYAVAMYLVTVDLDGSRLLRINKYTGCYPVSVNISEALGAVPLSNDQIKTSVTFQSQWFETNTLDIIHSFNLTSRLMSPKSIKESDDKSAKLIPKITEVEGLDFRKLGGDGGFRPQVQIVSDGDVYRLVGDPLSSETSSIMEG